MSAWNDGRAALPGLPHATHPGRVRLQVSNLSTSASYYRDVLGLDARHSPHGTLALGPRESATVLVELVEDTAVRPVPRDGLLGLYHFAILLPSREFLGRFIRHLATSGVRFSAADHLVSEALYLWDPDGLGIEVYADLPRAAWRRRDGELVMTTEPLDRESLVDAAGHEAWAGMPPGTTMGHMHLSVGNLHTAGAFYHAALGLDRTVWSYPGALFLSAGGYHHHLGLNTWSAGARPATTNDARLIEWELVLPDTTGVLAAAARLEGAGYDVQPDILDRMAIDPWGTRLRITAATSAAA